MAVSGGAGWQVHLCSTEGLLPQQKHNLLEVLWCCLRAVAHLSVSGWPPSLLSESSRLPLQHRDLDKCDSVQQQMTVTQPQHSSELLGDQLVCQHRAYFAVAPQHTFCDVAWVLQYGTSPPATPFMGRALGGGGSGRGCSTWVSTPEQPCPVFGGMVDLQMDLFSLERGSPQTSLEMSLATLSGPVSHWRLHMADSSCIRAHWLTHLLCLLWSAVWAVSLL